MAFAASAERGKSELAIGWKQNIPDWNIFERQSIPIWNIIPDWNIFRGDNIPIRNILIFPGSEGRVRGYAEKKVLCGIQLRMLKL